MTKVQKQKDLEDFCTCLLCSHNVSFDLIKYLTAFFTGLRHRAFSSELVAKISKFRSPLSHWLVILGKSFRLFGAQYEKP